jgi:succinyl-CoA synthetase beta subunit
VDLFEYQAKELFRDHGVAVSLGEVADTAADAADIASRIGGVTVVKAQVKVGGRGKAGGVRVAKTPGDAAIAAEAILGMDIKGHTVQRVLVDPGADIKEEYYVSFLLDRANRSFLAMASYEGGMEIEQLAEERPEALAKVEVDALSGVDRAKADEIVAAAKFPAGVAEQVAELLVPLWQTFVDTDATLVEVNPLARVADGSVLALDGKVSLDDNADFRQPRTPSSSTRRRATRWSSNQESTSAYRLEGEVGIIGSGQLLLSPSTSLRTPARRSLKGGQSVKPANPGHRRRRVARVMANGLSIILSDPAVRSVFVNVFGGITSCDAVANGIVAALEILGDADTKPLVVRLDGNNVEEGRRILTEAAHPMVTLVDTMDEAAARAAELAAGAVA